MNKRVMLVVIAMLLVKNVDAAATAEHSYLVRKQLFVQPNASAPAPVSDFVATLGGTVQMELPRWFVVTLPEAAVAALKAHPAVRYLQQVISGPVPSVVTAAAMHQSVPQRSVIATSGPDSGTYAYDGAGNIKAIGTNTYRYDAVSRLVEADIGGNHETYSYTNPAGAFGNMTSKTTTPAGGTQMTVDLSTDPGTNHLLGRTYDAAGNLVVDGSASNEFDPGNMQRQKVYLGRFEKYIYNAADERVGVVECGSSDCLGSPTVTWSVRDEEGKVLRQFEGTFGFGTCLQCQMWGWVEDYAYRGNELLAGERMPEDGGRRHFHLDHLGSARLVTAHDGEQIAQHEYYPFGVEIPPSFPETAEGYDREEPARFTGHERDFNAGTTSENANYNDYMHARYAVPQWGRFLSVDPTMDLKKAAHEPQMWNRYAYVTNNPLRYTDPDGRYRDGGYLERDPNKPLDYCCAEGVVKWAMVAEGGLLALAGGQAVYELGASAYGAYQAWRAASVAGATVKAVDQLSTKDGQIMRVAMRLAQAGKNTFENNASAVADAVRQVIGPAGRLTPIGKIGTQEIYGSARTGIGLAQINGQTYVVRMKDFELDKVLGLFRK